jgi:hypothetical protein
MSKYGDLPEPDDVWDEPCPWEDGDPEYTVSDEAFDDMAREG